MTGIGDKAAAMLDRYMRDSRNLRVSVGVLHGEQRFVADYADGQPADKSAPRIFEIGSITKTFTGSLLCKLLYQGRIRLDDRVSDFFGDLEEGYYYPTVEQLATHTAGYGESLPYSAQQRKRLGVIDEVDLLRTNPFRQLTDADLDAFVRQAKLTRETHPSVYSNLGIAVLGAMLAEAADTPILPLLDAFIRGDLGLRGVYTDCPPDGAVQGADSDGALCGNWRWDGGPFTCVGGLYATADTLLDYAARHLGNTPGYLGAGHVPRAPGFEPGTRMGLCWICGPDGGLLWHNGGTGCFKTFLGLVREKDAAVVVLSNQKARNGVTPEEIGAEILWAM